jgi:hypothetical protein
LGKPFLELLFNMLNLIDIRLGRDLPVNFAMSCQMLAVGIPRGGVHPDAPAIFPYASFINELFGLGASGHIFFAVGKNY